MIATGSFFLKKISHWLVVEQCSITVIYKSVALALTLESMLCPLLPGELKHLWLPLSVLAAQSSSASLTHTLFSLNSALFSHHLQSRPAASFPFLPSQELALQPQVPINRNCAVHIFKGHSASALATKELNTFSC